MAKARQRVMYQAADDTISRRLQRLNRSKNETIHRGRSMNILTLNSGSSSLSFKVYQHDGEDSGTILLSGKARNVATRTRAASFIEWTAGTEVTIKYCTLTNHRLAAQEVLILLEDLNYKLY